MTEGASVTLCFVNFIVTHSPSVPTATAPSQREPLVVAAYLVAIPRSKTVLYHPKLMLGVFCYLFENN